MAELKVFTEEYTLLDAEHKSLVKRIGDGSIITRFDKTPYPTKATDVVCPHFMELKWAYGCPFNCAWCYLKGTFRFLPTGTHPVFKDRKKIETHVRKFFEFMQEPEILNTGEIADSLMGEGLSEPFSKFLVPIFETQRAHKVLFLTKSTNIQHLMEIDSHDQVIVSFSLNAERVASVWEKGAPTVSKRIIAGSRLAKAGYEVRVRIDPIVPILNWQDHYRKLVDDIFDKFVPSRITLGSLRGLQSTINGSSDRSWMEYLKETSNWGKKVDFKTRHETFSLVLRELSEKYHYRKVALCKETIEMWSKLGLDYRYIKCNCTG